MPRRDSTTTPTAPFTNPRVLSKFRVSRILIPGRANMRRLDFVVGSVPVLGDIFDIAFKANIRNIDLLRDWMSR